MGDSAVVDIAVVVCTRDRPQLLTDLLPALQQAQDRGLDVVVVDSASRGPQTAALVRDAGLRLVRCEEPGASRARNAGFAATAAPVVVFVDDDCRPHEDWADLLAAAFDDDVVGFATGRVVPGAGPGRAMSPMERATPARWRAGDDVDDMGHGACVAFRRTAYAAVGGFDEVLGAGAPLHASEEKDLFWRLLRAGWEGRYVPESVVEHYAWRGESEALRNGFRYGVGIGARTVKIARLEGGRPVAAVLQRSARTLRETGRTIRAGHRFGTVNLTMRAAGVIVGGIRARRYPLVDGKFTG
jgi:GT2 family glycosyltransferase